MAAHRERSLFPSGQIFLDLRGTTQPLSPATAMLHVIRALERDREGLVDEASIAGHYRSILSGQRLLLLMDNVASAQQVHPLIPPPGSTLLITSRQHLMLPGMDTLRLGSLEPSDAANLLRVIAPRVSTATDEIAKLCGHLPLALRLAGNVLALRPDLSPDGYATRLANEAERLTELDLSDASEGIQSSLRLSDEILPEPARAHLRCLSAISSDFCVEAAAATCGVSLPVADTTLGILLSSSLLDWSATGGERGRYRMHDLVRLYASRRLSEPERFRAHLAHAEHSLEILAMAEEDYLAGGESMLHGLARFDRERENIFGCVAWLETAAAESLEAAATLSRITRTGESLLRLRQDGTDRIRWRELALGAVRRLEDRGREASALCSLADACLDAGLPPRAVSVGEEALAVARELGDEACEARALDCLGRAFAPLRDPARAVRYHEASLTIARRLGDHRCEGSALKNLGIAWWYLGEPERSIDFHRKHLALSRLQGDRRDEALALKNLGTSYVYLSDPMKAATYFDQSLELVRELGDRREQGLVLCNLALAQWRIGEPKRAAELYEESIVICREIGDQRGEAVALSGLSIVAFRTGLPERTTEASTLALKLARSLQDRRWESRALFCLALASWAQGRTQRALRGHRAAHAAACEVGDRGCEAWALWGTGLAELQRGALTAARRAFEDSAAIASSLGDRADYQLASIGICAVMIASGKPEAACGRLEAARAEGRALRDRFVEGLAAFHLGLARERIGDATAAIELHTLGLELASEVSDRRASAWARYGLGRALVTDGDLSRARVELDIALRELRAVQDAATTAEAAWSLGKLLMQLGQCEDAIELLLLRVSYRERIDHPGAARDRARVSAWRQRLPNRGSGSP